MIISLAYILIVGLVLGWLCRQVRFPALFGMILGGILIGPAVLNLIDGSILAISGDIRRVALIIILIRAGLKLSLDDLKKVGRPALMMCFVPASVEMLGMVLLAPPLLGLTRLEAATLGAVIAAVSPAVVVPKMIKLIDEGYGTQQGIPQMILAGASVDDVFVIVMFTTFTGLAQGGGVSVMRFVNIPVSIVAGIAVGMVCGFALPRFFKKFAVRDMVQALVLLCVSFVMVTLENTVPLPFAALISVMSMGLGVRMKSVPAAVRLSGIFDKLWVPAEVFLFVLVGASVAIESARNAGPKAVLLIFGVLLFRMAGAFLCVLGTALNQKERLFCMLAYTPKATVQAAIGGVPLAMGLACGQTVLTVSVIAILITAPLGAFLIDLTYKKFLQRAEK